MPERPKRKNKNKNKRKNKNNRVDNNKNNCELVEKESEESCSAQINDAKPIAGLDANVTNLESENDLNQNVAVQKESGSELACSDITPNEVCTSEDVNNNSSVIAANTLQVPDQQPISIDDGNIDEQGCHTYTVESPEQSLKIKPKLNNTNKSKSLDNDDAPNIVDVTEDITLQSEEESTLALVDTSNVLVSDVESDIEWEQTESVENPTITDIATETMSVSTVPLNVAHCQQINISLSPDIESSLRSYLQTLDLSTHPENSVEIKAEIEQIINREIRQRLRKKGFADDFGLQRLGPPRKLDVIDEEGSSESSKSSRRQSYLSDKKSDNEDLEDDVFEDKNKTQEKLAKRTETTLHRRTFGRLVPQQCVLVGAKIKEPEVSEARGHWTMQTVEKMTGAEVVYLTDSSSSTSSLHDYGDETDDGMETDVSVRMITPTIEVTDTEHLLKNSFIASNQNTLRELERNQEKEHIISIDYEKEHKDEKCSVPDQNSHEIVVLSTDDIKTNLYVKDVEPLQPNSNDKEKIQSETPDISKEENNLKRSDKYDLEIKVLKCELNDAINNLIKEVSDSEPIDNPNNTFVRQDSSSSVCSSQCTAKYNPTSSSLNDISNILHDEAVAKNNTDIENNENASVSSHVKDVIEHVAGAATAEDKFDVTTKDPSHLRDLCVKRIASLPFGEKILEELASVSKRIQKITGAFTIDNIDDNNTNKSTKEEFPKEKNMPYYPLPDLSPIEKVFLPMKPESVPPPVQPRHSSLRKKSREEVVWTGVPTKTEPVYVCLSPSQKMLMEKTQTVITKEDASELADMHKKYVERRGYNEHYSKEKQADVKTNYVSPIVPFKSQTGSRLLALIRDPAVTKNVNIVKNHSSLDHLEKKLTVSQISPTKHHNHLDLSKMNNTFKPIPPPRPKKLASSYYESDESSDFTDSSMRSMKSERKFFHFSTGNLNKEIEDDISSIQNMHRYYTNTRDSISESPRRPSLPKDLCDQQMEYIRQKEKEVEAEIQRLESLKNTAPSSPKKLGPRAPLLSESEVSDERFKDSNNYFISKRRDFFSSISAPEKHETLYTNSNHKKEKGKLSSVFSSSQEELLREKMYSEYVTQMAQREERKQHKVIKVTNTPATTSSKISKSMPSINRLDSKVNNRIEKEFISKARDRWDKLGIKDPETEDERDAANNVYKEPKVIEHKIKVIEGGKEKDVTNLPSHLQEFVRFTAKEKEQRNDSSETVMIAPSFKARSTSPAVWRPGAPTPPPAPAAPAASPGAPPPPPPPVWTPGSSPLAGRKAYRPVHFEDTPPTRRKFGNQDQNGCTSGSESEGRVLRTSQSAPVTGLNTLGSNSTSRLPKAQNPTVTLLQKAREGQLPRGSNYIHEEVRLPRDRPSPPRGDPVHALRREYASETEGERSEHERSSRKMADAQKKVDGIGPTTKEGMPVSLRSEVKDPSRWYKKMYDTIHKNKYDDDYVTIRYKSRRGQPPERVTSNKSQYAYFDPRSGYLSEPEGGLGRLTASTWSDAYDSDVTTGPRRRTASVQEDRRMNETITYHMPNNKYSTLASGRASQEVHKGQPGRIENYMPGRSSVVDKEAKQWWDEVMDIFDGQNISSTTSLPQASPKEKKDITSAILSKSNMARALKESGYESDSTLVFRRREDTEGPLSPAERRAAYRDLQAGGEPPLRGFRSPAPHRQETDSAPEPPRRTSHGSYSDTESPRRYVESDVNIHYRCPVRHDPLPLVPEKELARQQAEHMKRLYREQRRNKYLQENDIQASDIEAFDASMKELQDMQNRRHQDNFTPSQKNILPLNRYDEADRVVAKALYTFNGQTPRELNFRKGDIIHVRRQIDSNWYEGEIHGRIGLFPYNYVEIQKGDAVQAPKKPAIVEGRARAKFDFTAQTNLELPLKKGEVVVLTRRIDQNWWEGKNGTKTGIFPDSYVTILQEPSQNKPEPQQMFNPEKPVASPAAHGMMNGSAKRSMGAHSYLPQQNSQALSNAPPATQPLPGYGARQPQPRQTPSERGYGPPTGAGVDLNNTEPLYVDTNAEAVPYRAMYKYRPQNPDELELSEGDTVYVLEKCDDGWYVGSSQRTGRFGTFPGNYVERI